jgi:hypothetical protein
LAASRISESAREPQEEKMAYIKKPPELISRSLKLEQPVSELLDDYSNFIECTPDHVTNYVLKKLLSRDPEYKKWRAGQKTAMPARTATDGGTARRTS